MSRAQRGSHRGRGPREQCVSSKPTRTDRCALFAFKIMVVQAFSIYTKLHQYLWAGFFAGMLPGMWERTVSVHSGGKHFNVVGWRVGWAIGAAQLIQHLAVPHRLGTNCLPVYEQVVIILYIRIRPIIPSRLTNSPRRFDLSFLRE